MATPSSLRRRSSPPPLMAVFGSKRPSLTSLYLSAFSSLGHMALSLSLSYSRLTLTLDFGEPIYGSRVLCEVKTMEALGLWSRSHEAHGLAMVVGLNRGLCRGWWVFGRGWWMFGRGPCDCGFVVERICVW
jgi:hypothetical protein